MCEPDVIKIGCPFCKGDPHHIAIMRNPLYEKHPKYGKYYPSCDLCGATGPGANNGIEAAAKWDKRAPEIKDTCPFCGSPKTEIKAYNNIDHLKYATLGQYTAKCDKCGGAGPGAESSYSAWASWSLWKQ